MNKSLKNVATLALCIFLPLLAGGIGSLFTASSLSTWYVELAKPALNPPGWVFGPVWTVLYVLMGIAAFLVWKQGSHRKEVKRALSVFAAQLVANTVWSILFFGMQAPFYAFFDIVVLLVLILGMIVLFYRISKPAAYLLVPYAAWVSFATYLNYMLYVLN